MEGRAHLAFFTLSRSCCRLAAEAEGGASAFSLSLTHTHTRLSSSLLLLISRAPSAGAAGESLLRRFPEKELTTKDKDIEQWLLTSLAAFSAR